MTGTFAECQSLAQYLRYIFKVFKVFKVIEVFKAKLKGHIPRLRASRCRKGLLPSPEGLDAVSLYESAKNK